MKMEILVGKLQNADLEELSKRSGVGLTTLKYIRSGKIKNSGVSTVEKIESALKNCPLKKSKRATAHA